MMKVLIIVLVLAGFAWAYPPTRARIVHGVEPALVRLGPVGTRLMIPVQRYTTAQEVEFIKNQIGLARMEGRELPDERTFPRWLAKRVVTRYNGNDPWGSPYYLMRVNRTMTVGSMGQDRQRGTEDDIRKSVAF
jgi:hypothetical protein